MDNQDPAVELCSILIILFTCPCKVYNIHDGESSEKKFYSAQAGTPPLGLTRVQNQIARTIWKDVNRKFKNGTPGTAVKGTITKSSRIRSPILNRNHSRNWAIPRRFKKLPLKATCGGPLVISASIPAIVFPGPPNEAS